nr:hypothetical protein Q903MT_gene2818 [Picea sitchensis]
MVGACPRTPREPPDAFRDEAVGEAKSISGHQTLQPEKRTYVVTLPAFQRCLDRGQARRSRATGSGLPT